MHHLRRNCRGRHRLGETQQRAPLPQEVLQHHARTSEDMIVDARTSGDSVVGWYAAQTPQKAIPIRESALDGEIILEHRDSRE